MEIVVGFQDARLGGALQAIDAGREEGARLALGGNQVRRETGGCYVEPTLFDGVRPDMRIAREETFGPVLAVTTFRDEAEAVSPAEDHRLGLEPRHQPEEEQSREHHQLDPGNALDPNEELARDGLFERLASHGP